jgi:predicted PurR-regulated permease PerM
MADQITEHITVQIPTPPRRRSSVSQRLIIAGILVAACVWGSSIIMTLLVSVLFTYFLDPLVILLERLRFPRGLGALLVLLFSFSILGGVGYLLFGRLDQFSADWPQYSAAMRKVTTEINGRLNNVESRVSELSPEDHTKDVVSVQQEQHPLRHWLLGGLNGISSTLFVATFVPFLVFFMLAGKRQIWHLTLELFPMSQRDRAKGIFEELSTMLRSYLAGNALVAGILVLLSWGFFWILGLNNAFVLGLVCGVVNLVPYIGTVIAWVPPMIVGMTKWHSVGPFITVAAGLTAFHIVAMNVMLPAIVGRRVHLSALAVTLSLLFWGVMWGGLGLILAIPITAGIKVLCDHVEGWEPVGRWFGA